MIRGNVLEFLKEGGFKWALQRGVNIKNKELRWRRTTGKLEAGGEGVVGAGDKGEHR